jgi:hypothetical protein
MATAFDIDTCIKVVLTRDTCIKVVLTPSGG